MDGIGGSTLLAHFGGSPYGYAAGTVKACVAGLLRAGTFRVKRDVGTETTAVWDAGVREVFEKDRPLAFPMRILDALDDDLLVPSLGNNRPGGRFSASGRAERHEPPLGRLSVLAGGV